MTTKIKVPKTLSGSDAKDLRKKLGLNQQQFWSKVKMTQSAGSRYESGRDIDARVQYMIRLAYDDEPLKVLAELRGCKVAELCGGAK